MPGGPREGHFNKFLRRRQHICTLNRRARNTVTEKPPLEGWFSLQSFTLRLRQDDSNWYLRERLAVLESSVIHCWSAVFIPKARPCFLSWGYWLSILAAHCDHLGGASSDGSDVCPSPPEILILGLGSPGDASTLPGCRAAALTRASLQGVLDPVANHRVSSAQAWAGTGLKVKYSSGSGMLCYCIMQWRLV